MHKIVRPNEYLKWSAEMLKNPEFTKDLEFVDVTDGSSHRSLRSVKMCPNFTADYLRSQTAYYARSTSPWKLVVNVDRNRQPEYLLEGRCLCYGCIDPKTGIENVEDVRSNPIIVRVPVYRIPRKLVAENITAGCTCVLLTEQNIRDDAEP